MQDFRLSDEALTRVNELLKVYEGCRNYHNFSVGKESYETNSKRVIYNAQCEEKLIVIDNVEFAVIRIKGGSFLMHQIRRMIGLFLAVIRGVTDASIFDRAFSDQDVRIPTAPGLGLVLNDIHYDRFNSGHPAQGEYEQFTWTEFDEAIDEFQQAIIDPQIFRTEIENQVMFDWVEALLAWPFDDGQGKSEIADDEDSEKFDEETNKAKYMCRNKITKKT